MMHGVKKILAIFLVGIMAMFSVVQFHHHHHHVAVSPVYEAMFASDLQCSEHHHSEKDGDLPCEYQQSYIISKVYSADVHHQLQSISYDALPSELAVVEPYVGESDARFFIPSVLGSECRGGETVNLRGPPIV